MRNFWIWTVSVVFGACMSVKTCMDDESKLIEIVYIFGHSPQIGLQSSPDPLSWWNLLPFYSVRHGIYGIKC